MIAAGQSKCSDELGGIENAGICCAATCGSCGGRGCRSRMGGEENCCTGYIATNGAPCSETNAPPCIIDDDGECHVLSTLFFTARLATNCPVDHYDTRVSTLEHPGFPSRSNRREPFQARLCGQVTSLSRQMLGEGGKGTHIPHTSHLPVAL